MGLSKLTLAEERLKLKSEILQNENSILLPHLGLRINSL